MLTRLLAGLGALDRSAAHACEAIERARRAGHLRSLANALVVGCAQASLVRDIGSLRGRIGALAELTGAQGFAFRAVRTRCFAGWIAVEEGRVAEGTRATPSGPRPASPRRSSRCCPASWNSPTGG
jgi:hypothetical protein